MPNEDPTARARRVWDAMASRYDRDISFFEKVQFGGGRQWVCSRATGEVLEVAIGTGRNLPVYPLCGTITGIDVSPAMLALARDRATALGLDVRLLEADAQQLPFAEATFDTAVCTLSLCAIPDPAKALAEMARVLRPSGKLLLLDHIGSHWWPIWAGQRLIELFTIRAAGEYMTRRPALLLGDAGLRVVESQPLKLRTVERIAAVKRA